MAGSEGARTYNLATCCQSGVLYSTPVHKPVLTSPYCQLLNFCQLDAVEHYLILFLMSISLITCETEPLFCSASLLVNFIFSLIIYKHLFYILYTIVGHIGCIYFFLTYGLYFLFVYVTFYKKPSENFNINVIKLLVFFITVHPFVVLCLRNPIQL